MQNFGIWSQYNLEEQGLNNIQRAYWNLSPSNLIEEIIFRREGKLTEGGAVAVKTGKHTGRSSNDKFIVKYTGDDKNDPGLWWTPLNQSISPDNFEKLKKKMFTYMEGRDIFIQDMVVGAHPDYRIPIRVITERAWHSLMAWNIFLRLPRESLRLHRPDFTVIDCPGCMAEPEKDGTNSPTFIAVDFCKRLALIGGTSYAGEIKKSIFTIMNYDLPRESILSMHCAANVGRNGDVALFYGLSGTGKTTLSSDPERHIIGDDEHGWANDGIFNIEGGCYAKTIRLRKDLEPLIWDAVHRSGTILENVVYDQQTRVVNFDDAEYTENTRASYPLEFIPGHIVEGRAGHPQVIFLLTADAFGVLPLMAKLNINQAIYYFLSGYTSKIAGTEMGLGINPKATFSACYGAPFIPLNPWVYAKLFGEKIQKYNAQVWLINTGWTGGPFGMGRRVPLPYTRSMVRAVLEQQLDKIPLRQDNQFGLYVPETCPGVPDEVMDLKYAWRSSPEYQKQASELIGLFEANFIQFTNMVSPAVLESGPRTIN